MDARSWSSVAALLAFSALSIIAGAFLFRWSPWGWRLTILNQATQLVGIYTPIASFSVIHCVSVTVLFNVVPKVSFASSQFTQGVTTSVLHSVCDILAGKQLEGMPVYGISLNLVAAGILLYATVARRRANQLPDPTSPSATPPAGAGGAPSVAADHLDIGQNRRGYIIAIGRRHILVELGISENALS
jgi:hypothetical protein